MVPEIAMLVGHGSQAPHSRIPVTAAVLIEQFNEDSMHASVNVVERHRIPGALVCENASPHPDDIERVHS